jgi:hypothetical protein
MKDETGNQKPDFFILHTFAFILSFYIDNGSCLKLELGTERLIIAPVRVVRAWRSIFSIPAKMGCIQLQ